MQIVYRKVIHVAGIARGVDGDWHEIVTAAKDQAHFVEAHVWQSDGMGKVQAEKVAALTKIKWVRHVVDPPGWGKS